MIRQKDRQQTFLDAAAFAGTQTASNGKRPANLPADGTSPLTSPTVSAAATAAALAVSSTSGGGTRVCNHFSPTL